VNVVLWIGPRIVTDQNYTPYNPDNTINFDPNLTTTALGQLNKDNNPVVVLGPKALHPIGPQYTRMVFQHALRLANTKALNPNLAISHEQKLLI
jgi:hypothetical protein